jgi:hypothetical protein
MLCTQRPPWISDPDISKNSPVFPSILIINSLGSMVEVVIIINNLEGFAIETSSLYEQLG